MFRQKIKRLGSLFEIVDFRPMCKAGALLGFQVILYVNEQIYFFVGGLWLSGWAWSASNLGGNGFLGVVNSQSF